MTARLWIFAVEACAKLRWRGGVNLCAGRAIKAMPAAERVQLLAALDRAVRRGFGP